MTTTHSITLLAAFTLAGCVVAGPNPTPDFDKLAFRTDASSYVATFIRSARTYQEVGFTIIAQFENQSGATVYLNRCKPNSRHPIFSIELVEPQGRSGVAYDRLWACVGNNRPIEVRAGTVRIDTLRLTGPNSLYRGVPQGVFEGQFRLVYNVQSCWQEGGCSLPRQYSNVFAVRIEE